MSESTLSLYNSNSKIFCFSEKGEETVRREIAGENFFDLFRIQFRAGDDSLYAVDANGKEHTLYGPANGATVFLQEPDDAQEAIDKVVSLWKNSGLQSPTALNTATVGGDSISQKVAESLVAQLSTELQQVSANAIELDKQISVLREDLEDYRRNIEEVQLTQRLAGAFPSLSFERKPARSSLGGNGDVATQLLPYTGSVLSAFGVNLSNTRAAKGVLALWMTAREDDSVLASWEIDASELTDGWNNVALSKRIATRYRFVDLHVQWKGFQDQAPRVHLSDAFGDTQGFAVVAGSSVPNQMLALRVWTGNRFDDEVAFNCVHFSSDQDRLQRPTLYQKVADDLLKKVVGVTEPGGDREWLRPAVNGILVHPTSQGPSVAELNISLTAPMASIALTASVEHHKSRPVSFRVVVLAAESELFQRYQQDPNGKNPGALYEGDWVQVLPSTECPMICDLAEGVTQAKVLLMTKVIDGNESFAHAWFRNLMTAC